MGPVAERLPRIASFSERRIPSAILGVEKILEHLAAAGRCEFRVCSSMEPSPGDLAWADSLILVRGASPQEVRLQKEAIRLGKRTACYLDDDLEKVPERAVSGLFYQMPRIRSGIGSLLRDADLTLVTQEFLGQTLERRHGVSATILRQPRPTPPAGISGEKPNSDQPVRIGFLGSLDHHAFLEELLEAPTRNLHQEFGEKIQFVFCGIAPGFAQSIGAEVIPYEMDFHAWRRRAASLGIEIGLAPLPESDFHRSKYWNKYLEYGSLAIPGIYSEGSPNAQVVENGRTGLIAPNQPAAWEGALRTLITDAGLRREIAEASATDVEKRFSEAALAEQWAETLAPLLEHRAPAVAANSVQWRGGPWQHWLDRYAVYGVRNTFRMIRRRIQRTRG